MNKKRLLSLLVAGLMLAAMLLPAGAAEGGQTVDITIENAAAGEEYQAWKLLNLTTAEIPSEGDETEYSYSYTINAKYRDVLNQVNGQLSPRSDDPDLDAYILEQMQNYLEENPQRYASKAYTCIKEENIPADYTAVNGAFAGVKQGYYLIAQTTLAGESDTYSLVMLDTAGQDGVTVTPKKEATTLEHKILGDNGDVDAIIASAGDTVEYAMLASLPNLRDYNSYRLIFYIAPSQGLSVDMGSFLVESDQRASVSLSAPVVNPDDGSISLEVTGLYLDGGASCVAVMYTATVTDKVVMGQAGNTMSTWLEFTNDPLDADSYGKTPVDVVTVYSTGLTVNKVDQNENALAGAGFTLYKDNGGEEGYVVVKELGAAEDVSTFNFNGLGAGSYQLVETTVPDGYTKMEDLTFTIDGTISADETTGEPSLAGLTAEANWYGDEAQRPSFNADPATGMISTNVVNVAGGRLPGTGGAGTYAIYGGGAALLALGLAALVIKKRKSSSHAQ